MVQQVYSDIEMLRKEIRRLKGKIDSLSIGSSILPSSITIPPTSGGSGVVGSSLCVTIWQNNEGSTLSQGAVVARNGNRLFVASSTQGQLDVIGVLDGNSASSSLSVDNGGNGRIRHLGYQSVVNVTGTVVVGHYLQASNTAGKAEDAGEDLIPGCFAVALESSGPGDGQIAAFIIPTSQVSSLIGTSIGYIPFGSDASGQAFTP